MTAADGVGDGQLKKDVAAALGAHTYTYRTQAQSADASRKQMGGFLDVIKYAMLGFAAIAVLVGVFLIVNTFSMLVAQRTREIGLLRAVGSGRRQVNRSVLIEAVLLGTVGSVLGRRRGHRAGRGADEAMGTAGHEADHGRADRQVDDTGDRTGPRCAS